MVQGIFCFQLLNTKYKLGIFFLQKENVMIPGDPRYDPAARKKKIADLKVKTTNKQASKQKGNKHG